MTKTKTYYIVDDDSDDQLFLIEALTENDRSARCFTATNGKEAITKLKEGIIPLPDAIFLDMNMPRQDGRQCLAELKRTTSLQHIPVIIYSTSSNKSEIQQAMAIGASHYLVKKSSFKELCEELSMITATLILLYAGIEHLI